MAERITFDGSLYSPEAVEVAVAAYADHARIEVTPSSDGIAVSIEPGGDHDPRTLVHAFCNHVLYETLVRRRQSVLDEVV